MKLGLAIEYAGRGVDVPIERIRRCEDLGYDSVWTAEAYGSDAITPLAYIAAHTQRIRLGTAVIQVAARSPAMTAMQLGTVDAMAGGGRVIGGLGVSGPQIVEGWYGQPWGSPLERLRDYTLILMKIFAREGPVTHDGKELQLPYRGPGASDMGKPGVRNCQSDAGCAEQSGDGITGVNRGTRWGSTNRCTTHSRRRCQSAKTAGGGNSTPYPGYDQRTGNHSCGTGAKRSICWRSAYAWHARIPYVRKGKVRIDHIRRALVAGGGRHARF